jgi:capsular polysaccharide biosynthesis protein
MMLKFLKQTARRFAIPFARVVRTPALASAMRAAGRALRLQPPPPSGAVATTKEWAGQSHTDGRSYHEIDPGGTIERTLPKSIYSQPHWKFRERCIRPSLPLYVATIPQGRVVGRNGAVISGDNLILGDLSRDWFFGPQQHPLLFRVKLPKPRKLAGTTVTIAAPSAGWNYYHWMVDVPPRIKILEKGGVHLSSVDWIIVNEVSFHYQTATLERLGMLNQKLLFAGRRRHYLCDRLIAPSPVGRPDDLPPLVVQFLRESFLPKPVTGTYPPRIYVSRSLAKYRKFTNASEVRDCLAKHGFKEVFTEEMSFAEQVALFASVEAVVSQNGSGLVNIVFCRPGTKVLEIFSPDYVNVCDWGLANTAGLDYYYLLGAGEHPADHHDPERVEKDITVNIQELEATLALASLI